MIDPRTGRLMKKWETKKLSDEFSAASECTSTLNPRCSGLKTNLISVAVMEFLESREAQQFRPESLAASSRQPDVETVDSDLEIEIQSYDRDSPSSVSPKTTSGKSEVVSDRTTDIARSTFSFPSSAVELHRSDESAGVDAFHRQSNILLKQLFEERVQRQNQNM